MSNGLVLQKQRIENSGKGREDMPGFEMVAVVIAVIRIGRIIFALTKNFFISPSPFYI